MQKRKIFTAAIIYFIAFLLIFIENSYFVLAHTTSTIIPNCIPNINVTNSSYNIRIYPDKDNPTISINIQPQNLSSDDIVCKIPICGMFSDTYINQILCNVDGNQILPNITFSKKLMGQIDSYSYQEILDMELRSVSIPEEISIVKYTFSSTSSGSVSFTRPSESKIFIDFHSYSYVSTNRRYTVNTSTQEEFFYTFRKDIQDMDCVNTKVSRQEISLNKFIDELTSFGAYFLEPDFPISTLEHFYCSKLYEYLNNSATTYNFEEILLSIQSYGFIFYNFIIPAKSSPTTIQIEMPLYTATNTLYDPAIENFSLLLNKSSNFSLFIETTRKSIDNKYFQTQPNGYKFIGEDINQLILTLCESENPTYKFAKNNTLPEWQIILIILSSIIILCSISFSVYFVHKKNS